MKKSIVLFFVISMLAFVSRIGNAQEITKVAAFEKVIVSPHIEVILVAGNEESVTIENAKVADDKINIEVVGKTLRLYLDGAKTVTKSEKANTEHWKGKRSIYEGTILLPLPMKD